MRRLSIVAGALVTLAACAGGRAAQEPVYELRATETPLRYGVESEQLTLIELPTGGEQQVETSTAGLVTIAYGARTEEGLPFTLTFDSLDVQGPGGVADLSAVIGVPIRGTVGEGGVVDVHEAPEIEGVQPDAASLAEQLLTPLIPPLPPAGDTTAESWPLQQSRASAGGMSGEVSFDGTVRFAPEREWEGMPARILVSSGEVRQEVSGTPPGAPGKVDVDVAGESTTTYAWDPLRGAVLHVDQEVELEGTVSVQGMVLPMTVEAEQTFSLLTP